MNLSRKWFREHFAANPTRPAKKFAVKNRHTHGHSPNGNTARFAKAAEKIKPLPTFDPLPERLRGPVLLKLGDNISTNEVLPAEACQGPVPNNIREVSKFVFTKLDPTYHDRAMKFHKEGSFIVAGADYGHGKGHEHAAIASRRLGVRMVLAKSFDADHRENLVDFGILPLTFIMSADWEKVAQNDILIVEGVRDALLADSCIVVGNQTKKESYLTQHGLTPRQIEILLAGSLIDFMNVRSQFSFAGHQ